MTAPVVRRAVATDSGEVVRLIEAYCAEDRHAFDEPLVRRALEPLLDGDRFGTVGVLDHPDASGLSGYGVLTWGYSLESGGVDALIDELFVDPAHRGTGLGTAIIEWLSHRATDAGASRILLEVEAHNPSARRLYERLGWVPESSTMMNRWLLKSPADKFFDAESASL